MKEMFKLKLDAKTARKYRDELKLLNIDINDGEEVEVIQQSYSEFYQSVLDWLILYNLVPTGTLTIDKEKMDTEIMSIKRILVLLTILRDNHVNSS